MQMLQTKSLSKMCRWAMVRPHSRPKKTAMTKTPNIDPEAFEREWKNKYPRWQCLIVADGPSCPRRERLEQVRCKVIGTNRAYKRTRKLDIYVMVDPTLTKEIGKDLPKHVPGTELRMTSYPCKGSVTPITTLWTDAMPEGHYMETDLARRGWVMCCVVPAAIQVAYYLGFREIVFCGLDLHFSDGLHWYEGGKSRQVYMNHQINWLRLAGPVLKELGVRLINTSMHSAEKTCEKIPFREVFR